MHMPNKSTRLVLAFAVAMSMLFAAPLTTALEHRPPISAPFSLEPGALSTVVNFRIDSPGTYAVFVQFHYGKTAQDGARAYAILGGARKEETGKWSESGIPARFTVNIYKSGENRPFDTKSISGVPTSAGYYSRWASLAQFSLAAGSYTIEVAGTTESQELRGLPVEVIFASPYHGK
jgi:hypothetical protein